jgi:hypothetical protein
LRSKRGFLSVKTNGVQPEIPSLPTSPTPNGP